TVTDPHTVVAEPRSPSIVEVHALVRLLLDAHQPRDVRTEVLRRLRMLDVHSHARPVLRHAFLFVVQADPDAQIRLQAVAALGEFANGANGADVSRALGSIVADTTEPFELRYFALTSLARGGPTPSSLAVLVSVAQDDDLGKTASAIVARWQA